MYPYLLALHLLAAAIWIGGHFVLAFTVLPRALRERSPQVLLDFEQGYERIAMPAQAVQIASGLWLALQLVPDWTSWLTLGTPLARAIALKLALLAATLAVAAHARARLRIIPSLRAGILSHMAWHVAAVTTISVGLALTGISFRFGGLGH